MVSIWRVSVAACLAVCTAQADRPKIMITGYWPPTNEMVRAWSQDPVQNPLGWIGENWECRGYDIVSYFPEFPGGVGQNPKGNGDFEVDYQDTSPDWWGITAEVRPLALITFSRANSVNGWELESRNRKLPLNSWVNDYLAPLKPTADLPIAGEPDNFIRFSSLPMQEIVDAVDASGANVLPFIDTSNSFGGTFLSEFIGYHGNWYRDLHVDDPEFTCVAGGHIHVGQGTNLADAVLATEVTLRVLIEHVNGLVGAPCPADLDGDGSVGQGDLNLLLAEFGCTGGAAPCAADLDCDGATSQSDLNVLLANFGVVCQ